MNWQTDILAENGIVIAAKTYSGLDALISGADTPDTAPSFDDAAPRALTDGLEDLDLDPRLAAFWLWEYGAAVPALGQDAGRPEQAVDDLMPFYVPLVSAHHNCSLVEGADYIGEAELRNYLRGDIANDNWLIRRLK